MLARLLDGTTRGARWAALVAVAMAVGVLVGASALAGHPTRVVTVADGSSSAPTGSEHATGHRSAKPAKPSKEAKGAKASKAPKPATTGSEESEVSDTPDDKSEADETGDGGVHGACVAAVAQDTAKVGGPHHNHGYAVSRAAHTCPHPEPGSSTAGG